MSFSFADFKARFPELSSTDEGFFNTAKSSASLSVNQDIWMSKYTEGWMLMTAHVIALSNKSGATGQAGNVIEEEVDDLRIKYADTNTNGGGSLDSTSYGQEFKRMMNCTAPTPLFFC